MAASAVAANRRDCLCHSYAFTSWSNLLHFTCVSLSIAIVQHWHIARSQSPPICHFFISLPLPTAFHSVRSIEESGGKVIYKWPMISVKVFSVADNVPLNIVTSVYIHRKQHLHHLSIKQREWTLKALLSRRDFGALVGEKLRSDTVKCAPLCKLSFTLSAICPLCVPARATSAVGVVTSHPSSTVSILIFLCCIYAFHL